MSLRLDLQGIGESEGDVSLDIPRLYQDRLVEQIEIAMDSLRSRTGARRFAIIGLCSGAFWAFHAAIRNRDVRAAILLNPRLFFWDPEVDRRRMVRRTARLLTESTDWGRLIRGYVSLDSVKRVSRIVIERFRVTRVDAARSLQISPVAMSQAWEALQHNQSRVALIFTEGEPLLREMAEEGHLPAPDNARIQCVRVTNCGHTFRPLWAQKMAHEMIDKQLEAAIDETKIDETATREAHPQSLPQVAMHNTLSAE
jgi:pimeloyl-ACP methyl ester carboxylesterase